jgi:predicted transcriptional regulator
VLAQIADVVNQEGFGWPSFDYIAEQTEVDRRTVARMVQVFASIGLLKRFSYMTPDGYRVMAIQVNLTKLGGDLSAAFKDEYKRVQKKKPAAEAKSGAKDEGSVAATPAESPSDDGSKCRSDQESVAATLEKVAATSKSVAATFPPHPLIGGTVIEPSLNQKPPLPPCGGVCADEFADDVALTPEQQAHVDAQSGTMRAMFERHYREENHERAEAARRDAETQREAAELEARMMAAIPDVNAGVLWVMRECGQVEERSGRGLEALLRAVFDQGVVRGEMPWKTGPAIKAAWEDYGANAAAIRMPSKFRNFIRSGEWRDRRRWRWDRERMERHAAASVGSYAT